MRIIPAGLATLWLAIATPLGAQVVDTATRLPELKVTVVRSAVPLAGLGASVTVVDSDAIHRGRLATGLDEALAYVPGVVAQNRWNFSVDQRLSIRGFGARANFGLRGVKVLLDGVPQTLPDGQSQLNNLNMSLVNRIEVLRGGASALYGNAAGGTLSFTTRAAPSTPWSITARGEGGTFGTSKEEIVLGGRLGAAGGTLAVSRFYTDGFRAQSAADQRRLSLGFDWAASSRTSLTFRVAAANDPRARNPGALTMSEYLADPAAAAPNNVRRGADKAVSQTQFGIGIRHDATQWHLDATVYALTRDLENPLATPPPAPTSINQGTWVAIDRIVGGGRVSATVDLRRVAITGGVDVQRLRDNRTNRRSVSGVATDTLFLDQEERVTELAGFAQLSWALTGRVTLRAGARQDINKFAVADRFLSDGNASANRSMPATSGNAGISIRLADEITAWTNIATVFETPTTTELANRADGVGGFNPDLNPQRSVTEEVGVRGRTGRLSFDVAVYHTITNDAIVPYNEVAGRTYFRNAGSTRTQGIEAGLRLELRRGLSLLATWTHTDATFGIYRIPGTTSTDTLDGHRLAGLPRNVARIGVQGALGHGFSIDIDQAFASEIFGDDDNTIKVDGWSSGVTGARLAWRGNVSQLEIAPFVAVMNLTNRRYIGSVTTNGAGGRVFEPSAGRTLYAGMSLTAAPRATVR